MSDGRCIYPQHIYHEQVTLPCVKTPNISDRSLRMLEVVYQAMQDGMPGFQTTREHTKETAIRLLRLSLLREVPMNKRCGYVLTPMGFEYMWRHQELRRLQVEAHAKNRL